MNILGIHTVWPEKQGFVLNRQGTESFFVFVHFLSSVTLKGGESVQAGACILYKPHSYRYFCAENEPLLHDWFHAEGDFLTLFNKYGLETNKFYYPANDNEITKILQEIEFECLTKKTFYESVCTAKLEELVAKIARGTLSIPSVDRQTYKRFLKLRTYVQSNFYKISKVEELCSEVGLSASRFYIIYKKIFGISPKQDLLNIRIEHAKQLLSQKQNSITEISDMLGYNNLCHFVRQFREATGKSPSEYCKQF